MLLRALGGSRVLSLPSRNHGTVSAFALSPALNVLPYNGTAASANNVLNATPVCTGHLIDNTSINVRAENFECQSNILNREILFRHSESSGEIAQLLDVRCWRIPGIPLNLEWVHEVRVNTSAVERRAQSQTARRTVKKEWQAAWLLRAITCMDLTTLSGDDTDERVRRLCAKGKHPIQPELEQKLGIESLQIKVAAICVYHTFVETALRALEGSGVHVAAVSTGFPCRTLATY